jgi:hypothetical protein
MRLCEPQDTGRTVAMSGLPLAVACLRCTHRRLLTPTQLQAHENDGRELLRLPLLCRCGSRNIELYLMETPDDETAFLAGDTPLATQNERATGWHRSF